MNILFVTEFGSTCGMGHLSRSKSLAASLIKHLAAKVYIQCVNNRNWPDINLPFSELISLPIDELEAQSVKYDLDIVIADLPQHTDDKQLSILRRLNIPLICVDDLTDRRLLATVNFYPPISQLNKLNWDGFQGSNWIGWDYCVLNSDLKQSLVRSRSKPKLLISLGGSDAFGLHIMISENIQTLLTNFDIDFVVGPLVDLSESEVHLMSFSGLTVHHNPSNFLSMLARSDFCLVTYGVTVYELAYLKVPTIVITTCADHEESGKIFWDDYSGFSHVSAKSSNLNEDITQSLCRLKAGEKYEFPMFHQSINNKIVQTIKEI